MSTGSCERLVRVCVAASISGVSMLKTCSTTCLPGRPLATGRRWLAAALVVAASLAIGQQPRADAHASVAAAWPLPGSIVGGAVSDFEVVFDQPVVTLHLFQVETRDGIVLAGSVSQPFYNTIRFELDEPLADPGVYISRYTITAADGDTTPNGYAFTFDPTGPQQAAIDEDLYGLPTNRVSGQAGLPVLALIGGGVALPVLAVALLRSRSSS